jgi:hypothetical protein
MKGRVLVGAEDVSGGCGNSAPSILFEWHSPIPKDSRVWMSFRTVVCIE